MRVGLITYGSRGDVEPFVALALGLKKSGHEVTLAAPKNFENFLSQYDIEFWPLPGDTEELVSSPECLKVISSGNNMAFMRMAMNAMNKIRNELADKIYVLSENVDLVLAASQCIFYVAAIAERLNKKWMLVQLNPPMIPTREFPILIAPFPDIKAFNKFSYHLIIAILWHFQKQDDVSIRQRLNMPPSKKSVFDKVIKQGVPIINAYSQEFIKRPADWVEQYVVTGFLRIPFEKAQKEISKEIEDWLNIGEKPLYIGFGSIPFPNNKLLEQTIKDLLAKTNVRIIFCKGWSKITDLAPHPNLFVIDNVPHSWLMPKCRAALVHGGIGTLAGIISSGIPAIVASIFVDQPAWGKIIARQNLGVHFRWNNLSAKRIIDSLEKIETPQISQNVINVSKRLAKEDGVTAAIKAIEKF